MKKAISLLLALVMCLSLCACGENSKPDGQPVETTSKVDTDSDTSNTHDDFYSLRGTDHLEFTLYMDGREWTVDDGDGLGLPTKLKFQSSDGTCVATNPARQETLYWGYAPGSDTMWSDMYVRVGTQDDILYLFHVSEVSEDGSTIFPGSIALHSFVSDDGIPVEGLTEDGYEAMWSTATGD